MSAARPGPARLHPGLRPTITLLSLLLLTQTHKHRPATLTQWFRIWTGTRDILDCCLLVGTNPTNHTETRRWSGPEGFRSALRFHLVSDSWPSRCRCVCEGAELPLWLFIETVSQQGLNLNFHAGLLLFWVQLQQRRANTNLYITETSDDLHQVSLLQMKLRGHDDLTAAGVGLLHCSFKRCVETASGSQILGFWRRLGSMWTLKVTQWLLSQLARPPTPSPTVSPSIVLLHTSLCCSVLFQDPFSSSSSSSAARSLSLHFLLQEHL